MVKKPSGTSNKTCKAVEERECELEMGDFVAEVEGGRDGIRDGGEWKQEACLVVETVVGI